MFLFLKQANHIFIGISLLVLRSSLLSIFAHLIRQLWSFSSYNRLYEDNSQINTTGLYGASHTFSICHWTQNFTLYIAFDDFIKEYPKRLKCFAFLFFVNVKILHTKERYRFFVIVVEIFESIRKLSFCVHFFSFPRDFSTNFVIFFSTYTFLCVWIYITLLNTQYYTLVNSLQLLDAIHSGNDTFELRERESGAILTIFHAIQHLMIDIKKNKSSIECLSSFLFHFFAVPSISSSMWLENNT